MKKYIIGFIVGIIISGIGVYAITASEVTYHDTTIDQALDNLYNNIGKIDLSKLTFSANSYQGTKTQGVKTSKTLNKGNYIIIGIEAFPSPVDSYNETSVNENGSTPGINQTSDICQVLGRRRVDNVPTIKYNNQYERLYLHTRIWKCSFENDNNTVEIIENVMGASSNNLPLTMMIEAIKLD